MVRLLLGVEDNDLTWSVSQRVFQIELAARDSSLHLDEAARLVGGQQARSVLKGEMMRKCIGILLLAMAGAFALSGAQLSAAVISPAGLAPGSEYQLIFVTSGAVVGSHGNEAFYNTFVNAQAAQNPSLPSTTWNAITSTADGTVATTNAPWLGLPVYNTHGDQVNLPLQSLYATGSISNPPAYDQFGTYAPDLYVWTGTDMIHQGNYIAYSLGGSSGTPVRGISYATNDNYWITADILSASTAAPVYALSGIITVPVPEPSTSVLLGIGLAVMAVQGLRKATSRILARRMATACATG